MAATVRIKLGNVLDDASDLIVLPCSTAGTVSGLVPGNSSRAAIPHPKDHMKLGEVDIRSFKSREGVEKFVAFAASVEHFTSSFDAVEKIGKELGKFIRKNPSVRTIAVPLLGTGAGVSWLKWRLSTLAKALSSPQRMIRF